MNRGTETVPLPGLLGGGDLVGGGGKRTLVCGIGFAQKSDALRKVRATLGKVAARDFITYYARNAL